MHAPSIRGYDAAEKVLSVLVSSAYRRNSLPGMNLAECRPQMLSNLRQCTKSGSPIQLTVLAFPFKVPNPVKVGARRLPDFAEFAAICHFRTLRDAVQAVYPPGLDIHILHDGSLIADVFGIDLREVRQYEAYFAKLVDLAGASDFIHCHDFSALQQRQAFKPDNSLERLQSEAETWWQSRRGTAEWRDSFQKTLGMMNLRELPSTTVAKMMDDARVGHLPAGCAEIEGRVHRAMIQYHVRDAIIHEFDPRPCCFPAAIHATTRNRRGRLSIWLVRRGQSLLPWHGVGSLDDRGYAQVAHAMNVADQANYCPVTIAGEETPFVYRKSATSESFALDSVH
jgi:pyoverdine/dityrosine biosynthesis protein Dit1